MTWIDQDELVTPTTRFVSYRCDFCRLTYMRPEGETTCPGCKIRPMRPTQAKDTE